MPIEDVLVRARVAAEAIMRGTCRVTRPAGARGEFNEDSLQYDPPDPVVVYEGKFRIPRSASSAASVDAGVTTWQVGEYPFAVPITDADTAEIGPGQTVLILTHPDDPAMVGWEFGVVEPIVKSAAKDRRFKVKRVVSL